MHKRAIACGICGRKFFPASLPFHLKACQEKHARLVDQLAASMPKRNRAKWGNRKQRMKQDSRPIKPSKMPLPSLMASTDEPMSLTKCHHCGRKFSILRIEKHMSVCGSRKKRRVFDSSSQRRIDNGDSTSTFASRASSPWKASRYTPKLSRSCPAGGLNFLKKRSKTTIAKQGVAPSNSRRKGKRSGGGQTVTFGRQPTTSKAHRPLSEPAFKLSPQRRGWGNSREFKTRNRFSRSGTLTNSKKRMSWNANRMSVPSRRAVSMHGSSSHHLGDLRSLGSFRPHSHGQQRHEVAFSSGWSRGSPPSRFAGGRGKSSFTEGKGGFDPSNRTSTSNPLCTNAWQAAPH
mmetsp:Transcript_33210/g.53952  ORF Transcript_33210/g.53952 Transcript_33210/m.53952 type:complete len:346 (+) Transcript_33210:169-1206(+)